MTDRADLTLYGSFLNTVHVCKCACTCTHVNVHACVRKYSEDSKRDKGIGLNRDTVLWISAYKSSCT